MPPSAARAESMSAKSCAAAASAREAALKASSAVGPKARAKRAEQLPDSGAETGAEARTKGCESQPSAPPSRSARYSSGRLDFRQSQHSPLSPLGRRRMSSAPSRTEACIPSRQ